LLIDGKLDLKRLAHLHVVGHVNAQLLPSHCGYAGEKQGQEKECALRVHITNSYCADVRSAARD